MAQEKTERRSSTLETGQVSVAETLAGYAINLRYEHLPQEVVRTAKRTILDTVGCAIGGYSAGPSQIAIKLANEVSAKHGATVLCSGIKTSPDLAVFANGVMIRCLDFNDGFVSFTRAPGHPSDTLAVLLTAAELSGGSGRDLIAATVLSYEVFCKVLDVLDTQALGLDHSTITGLAAVVGAGRLMALSQQQLVHAIGITVGGNTAITQGRRGTLSNWKSFAAADACRKALFSVQLAQSGMTGPSQVFEGRSGFFNVISRGPFTLPALGEPYGIMRTFTKLFALGQFSQTVAQAAVEARQFFKDPGEIQEINIGASSAAIKIMADSPDKWRPQTSETADHSMPYAAGVALMYGKVGPEYYEDRYSARPGPARSREPSEMHPFRGSRPKREGIQSVRSRDRAEVRRAQEGAGRVPPGALEKSDDRRRNGGKISFDGAQAAVCRARRQSRGAAVEPREPAAGGRAHRRYGGLIAVDLYDPCTRLATLARLLPYSSPSSWEEPCSSI